MTKKIKTIIPVLALALALVAGNAMSALAESSSYDGTCSFKGTKITSDFSSSTVAKAIENLEPGDDVTFTVQYSNNDSDDTAWYMENSVIKTLEKTEQSKKHVEGTGVAEGSGYTYSLTHYNHSGARNVLFSNDKVGGEAKPANMEGLEQATNALDDWFYIDTLSKGQSGKVVLHVAFEGETEVNDYMDTDGELNLRFAVEKNPVNPPEKTTKRRIIKTGDQSRLIMWTVITFIAGLLLIVLALISRKKDEKSGGAHDRRR